MRPGISISTNPKTSESQKWAESTLYARNLQVNCTDHQSKTAKHSGRPNTHVASPIYSSVWVSWSHTLINPKRPQITHKITCTRRTKLSIVPNELCITPKYTWRFGRHRYINTRLASFLPALDLTTITRRSWPHTGNWRAAGKHSPAMVFFLLAQIRLQQFTNMPKYTSELRTLLNLVGYVPTWICKKYQRRSHYRPTRRKHG